MREMSALSQRKVRTETGIDEAKREAECHVETVQPPDAPDQVSTVKAQRVSINISILAG